MAIPDFQTAMRPVLVALEDGQQRKRASIRSAVASHFSVSPAELEERNPNGRDKMFHNRVGWAITYLYRAGLISRPKPATYQLTDRGKLVLAEHPDRVDLKVLSQFEEFNEFKQTKSSNKPPATQPDTTAEQTPEEQIDHAYSELQAALAADVLDRVYEKEPEFFELLVLDVLRAMGYGGSETASIQHLGKSGDEGIDGVIREDELGLDLIYVQAKRWANAVGRPEIQKFFGALSGQGASKGVFITTATFTAEAEAYASSVTPRVVLVDGKTLARLMIEHDVGVTVARSYKLKRIDLDYFSTDGDDVAVAPDPAASP
jgi:restriction system protein